MHYSPQQPNPLLLGLVICIRLIVWKLKKPQNQITYCTVVIQEGPKPQTHVTRTEKFTKLDMWFLRYASWLPQTYRHADCITSHSSRGQSNRQASTTTHSANSLPKYIQLYTNIVEYQFKVNSSLLVECHNRQLFDKSFPAKACTKQTAAVFGILHQCCYAPDKDALRCRKAVVINYDGWNVVEELFSKVTVLFCTDVQKVLAWIRD